jgi:hypothetical protein
VRDNIIYFVISVQTGIQNILKTSGFLLEFIPMKIGAGMTFLEVVFNPKSAFSPSQRALPPGQKPLWGGA